MMMMVMTLQECPENTWVHTYVLPKVRGRSPSGHYLLHTWRSRTLVHRKICVVVGQTKRDRNIAREWVARSTSCGRPFNALFDVGMRVFNSAQVISRNTLRATPPRTIGTEWYSKHKHVEKTWQNRFEKAGRLPKFYFTSARLNCVPCAKQTVSSNNDNLFQQFVRISKFHWQASTFWNQKCRRFRRTSSSISCQWRSQRAGHGGHAPNAGIN